jgi:hypothetical protein
MSVRTIDFEVGAMFIGDSKETNWANLSPNVVPV